MGLRALGLALSWSSQGSVRLLWDGMLTRSIRSSMLRNSLAVTGDPLLLISSRALRAGPNGLLVALLGLQGRLRPNLRTLGTSKALVKAVVPKV